MMLRLVSALALLLTATVFAGCEPAPSNDPATKAKGEQARKDVCRRIANNITEDIIYLKDTRPAEPICFAYIYESSTYRNGGPGLTTVPCHLVEHLLANP